MNNDDFVDDEERGPVAPLDRLAALAAATDVRFERIRARHADRMRCRAGCSACCRARLSVTRVEAAALERELQSFDEQQRATLARRARDPTRETCPALDADGRCGVYRARPIICRSFGVPLRRYRDVPLINPPETDVCDLNFGDVALPMLPAADVLDRTSLDAALESIDRRHCDTRGLPRRDRIPLTTIFGCVPGGATS